MSTVNKHVNAYRAKIIFDAIKNAGISVSLFSRVVRTTRATLYKWRNRPEEGVDAIRFNMAFEAAVRLNTAVEQKRLPLQDQYSPAAKEKVIREIIRTTKPVNP